MVILSPHITHYKAYSRNNIAINKSKKEFIPKAHNKNLTSFASSNILASYSKALISFKGFNAPAPTLELIKDLTSDPRNSFEKRRELENKYGSGFYNWLYNDYSAKFTDFTEKMFNEASSIEELIKFRPDWKPSKLSEKFHSLNPYSDGLTIGRLPEGINDKNTFNQIINHLSNSASSSGMNSFYESPSSSVNIEGKNFTIKPLSPGKTGKRPFLVETQEGKKYLIKIDPGAKSFDHKMDSCDSVGLQAIIDYYLTANDCQNCAQMHFYDEKTNAAIYEFIEKDQDYAKAYSVQSNTSEISSKIPDVFKLGITYNDTMGSDNILKANETYKMIDSGHCTFSNSLKPMVREYQRELPNLMQFQF